MANSTKLSLRQRRAKFLEDINRENKCVETIHHPPKCDTYGDEIVQTTTWKRLWRHRVVWKSLGGNPVSVRVRSPAGSTLK